MLTNVKLGHVTENPLHCVSTLFLRNINKNSSIGYPPFILFVVKTSTFLA